MDLNDALGDGGSWPGGGGGGNQGGGVWPGGAPSPNTWPGGAGPGGWPGQPSSGGGGPGGWPGQPSSGGGGPGGWPGQPSSGGGGPGGWPGQPSSGTSGGGPGGWPGQPTTGPSAGGPGGWPSQPSSGPSGGGSGGWPSSGGQTWPAGGGQPGGGQPGGGQPGWPQQGQGGGGPSMPSAPQTSLKMPYSHTLPKGVYDKLLVTVVGTVKPNANMFTFNMSTSRDVAFHFNPRFNEDGKKVIVRNSEMNKTWGVEERELRHFPFTPGQQFEMKILCTKSEFKVAVNKSHLVEFKHRIHNLSSINLLYFCGDINLSAVNLETLP